MEGVWPGLYECLQPIGRTEVISYAVSVYVECVCVCNVCVCVMCDMTVYLYRTLSTIIME